MAGTNKLSDKKLKALLGVKKDSPAMIADGERLSIINTLRNYNG
ncbi:hypothetical protein [Xenorhabdus koppenhoeferi]|nr:hypothetical protein [Xenorhabdus sp. Vera]